MMATVPSPEAILAGMSAAYAAAQSYGDTGEVLMDLDDRDEPYGIAFETFFGRPEAFKFMWVAHHPHPPLQHITWRSALWSDGAEAHVWLMHDEPASVPQSMPDVEMAVAAATGVSGGSALTIAKLLMPRIDAHSIHELTRLRHEGIEDVEGVACHHISGTGALGACELWIATDDLLLRRMRHSIEGTTFEETRRNVKVDVAWPPGTFSFSR